MLARWLVLLFLLPAQAPPDPFAPLRYFVGAWRGTASGQAGDGAVERSYEFVLNNRFLQVRNKSVYPPQAKNKAGETHQDLGMIGFDRDRRKLVLRQFHVEGFVNTYVQEADKPLFFVTEAIENIPAGWRARETYTILSPDEFVERFELAEPGKDFQLYSESRLKRVR